MNPDACPRCGLPENWTLKVRLRLVFVTILIAFVAGVMLGRLT